MAAKSLEDLHHLELKKEVLIESILRRAEDTDIPTLLENLEERINDTNPTSLQIIRMLRDVFNASRAYGTAFFYGALLGLATVPDLDEAFDAAVKGVPDDIWRRIRHDGSKNQVGWFPFELVSISEQKYNASTEYHQGFIEAVESRVCEGSSVSRTPFKAGYGFIMLAKDNRDRRDRRDPAFNLQHRQYIREKIIDSETTDLNDNSHPWDRALELLLRDQADELSM